MGSSQRLIVLLALCVLGGFFAGRAYWTLRAPTQAPAGIPATPAVTALPEVRLPDLQGNMRSLREWSEDALLLNFWATWCAPCRKEMPLLERVYQERGGRGLAVVGIAIDREDPVRRFVAETGVTYPILVGEGEAMAAAEAFGPQFVGLPLTVVAAPGGSILKAHTGELRAEHLRAIVTVVDQLAAGSLTEQQARAALENLGEPAETAGL